MNRYHDWYEALSEEQRAIYADLLAHGRCVKCHIESKPHIFGDGQPVEILPDDSPLIFGEAKHAKSKKKAKE